MNQGITVEIDDILTVEKYLADWHGIIFDLDDTLYSEKDYVKSGYNEVGKILPEVVNASEKLWYFFEKGFLAIDELLSSEGLYSKEVKEKCMTAYRSQVPHICLYPGLREMIVRLKKAGKKLGIITDVRGKEQK